MEWKRLEGDVRLGGEDVDCAGAVAEVLEAFDKVVYD